MGDTRSPAAAHRQQLLREKRQERWRNLWRLLVFTAAGSGLAMVLLRQGWMLEGPGQLQVSGSRLVTTAQVVEAGQLQFPTPLLSIEPSQLAERISASLPVEQVQVSRLMLPPRLRIQLIDRQAVARAERPGPHGPVPGYVDRRGNWMVPHQQGNLSPAAARRLVRGWQPEHRQALALLFQRADQLGGTIETIEFRSDGSLWLRLQPLGLVRLGQDHDRLSNRLDVLAHLAATLPQRLQGRSLEAIDLTDPLHPELSLPAPAAGANRPVATPARD